MSHVLVESNVIHGFVYTTFTRLRRQIIYVPVLPLGATAINYLVTEYQNVYTAFSMKLGRI
jgi:hypothetical protein